jgi:hypothetical protein
MFRLARNIACQTAQGRYKAIFGLRQKADFRQKYVGCCVFDFSNSGNEESAQNTYCSPT